MSSINPLRLIVLPAALAVFVAGGLFDPLQAETVDGPSLIQTVRNGVAQQRHDVEGMIRKEGMKSTPVKIFLRGEDYQFHVGGDRYHLRLGKAAAELFTITEEGAMARFPPEKLSSPIAGADVTFEDFSLLFLYWPNAALKGEDQVNGEDCYRVELHNPGKDGAYQTVFVWIHKKHRVFWRIKGFDAKGDPTKQIDVLAVMQMDNAQYGIKSMKISSLGTENRVSGITYLDLEPRKAVAPRGR